uniref:Putative secreted protein n=1 Tax=Anopheles darlingi TaxID=43151 RepID=A0A2M4DE36_ANODA
MMMVMMRSQLLKHLAQSLTICQCFRLSNKRENPRIALSTNLASASARFSGHSTASLICVIMPRGEIINFSSEK